MVQVLNRAVLIVDDEAAHRILARRALSKLCPELQVLEGASVADGRRWLSSHLSALVLVILDVNLDHESGLEILKELRAQRSYLELACIVISTSDLESDMHQSYREGANCYVIKDTDSALYLANLRDAVRFLGVGSFLSG